MHLQIHISTRQKYVDNCCLKPPDLNIYELVAQIVVRSPEINQHKPSICLEAGRPCVRP